MMTNPYEQQPQPEYQQPQYSVSSTIVPNPFPTYWHIIHGVLTLGTCFIYSPIYLIHYATHKKFRTITTTHRH